MVCFTSSSLSPQSEGSRMEYNMNHNRTLRSCFTEDDLLSISSSIEIGFNRIQKLQANYCPPKETFSYEVHQTVRLFGWLVKLVGWFTAGILHI
jgi:hypothetical protein